MAFTKYQSSENLEPVSAEENARIATKLQRLGKKSVAELTEQEREELTQEEYE